MRPVAVMLAACLMATGQETAAREGVASLAEKLRRDPGNFGLIVDLAKHPDDPSAIPALRDAFALDKASGITSDLGSSRLPASFIAATVLIKAGVQDEVYFNEMVRYVREAIDADPPGRVGLPGPDGKEQMEKGYDRGFEVWCAKRNLEPLPCLQKTTDYGMVFVLLSGLKDPRAIPVLREALAMSSAAIVSVAATGLAQLNDAPSISLIAQNCSRFRPKEAELIGVNSEYYDSPAVELIFNSCIADTDLRAKAVKERAGRIAAKTPTAQPQLPK